MEQYSRRENLIISGIPDSVPQKDLEHKVLQVLNTIGCDISKFEIVAAHRIGRGSTKYPAQTIVRFTNRKIVSFCMTNRDRLKECRSILKWNLRFYENLCEDNEHVRKMCQKLKTADY